MLALTKLRVATSHNTGQAIIHFFSVSHTCMYWFIRIFIFFSALRLFISAYPVWLRVFRCGARLSCASVWVSEKVAVRPNREKKSTFFFSLFGWCGSMYVCMYVCVHMYECVSEFDSKAFQHIQMQAIVVVFVVVASKIASPQTNTNTSETATEPNNHQYTHTTNTNAMPFELIAIVLCVSLSLSLGIVRHQYINPTNQHDYDI